MTPEARLDAIFRVIEGEARHFRRQHQLGFDCLPIFNLVNHWHEVERLVHGLATQVRGKQLDLFARNPQKQP